MPVLVGGVWCQGSVLVQLCLPGRCTVTLDIIGKEVGIGWVRIDALTLQRYLVTWHVIGCHCRRCVSLELVDPDWLKRDSSHRFQLSKHLCSALGTNKVWRVARKVRKAADLGNPQVWNGR